MKGGEKMFQFLKRLFKRKVEKEHTLPEEVCTIGYYDAMFESCVSAAKATLEALGLGFEKDFKENLRIESYKDLGITIYLLSRVHTEFDPGG